MDGKMTLGSRPDMPAGEQQPMAKRLVQPQPDTENRFGATTRGKVPGAQSDVVSYADNIKVGDNPTGRHGTQSTVQGTKQKPWTPQKP